MSVTMEQMLAMLEDKIVQTQSGPYISVGDLKQLEGDLKEAKAADLPKGVAKTLHGARKQIKEDPDVAAMFELPIPRAPADADVVKPVAERIEA